MHARQLVGAHGARRGQLLPRRQVAAAEHVLQPGALAAVLPPAQGTGGEQGSGGKGGQVGMALGIVGGVVAGAALIALVMMAVLRRARRQNPEVNVLPKSLPPAKKKAAADGGKAPAKVTQRIVTPAEKSKSLTPVVYFVLLNLFIFCFSALQLVQCT